MTLQVKVEILEPITGDMHLKRKPATAGELAGYERVGESSDGVEMQGN